jgi:hypothetical protein
MGTHDNVGYYEFPVQDDTIGTHTGVIRRGLTTELGEIRRDDLVDPLVTIIELECGTIVLGTEKDNFTEADQGEWLGRRVDVCYNRDETKILEGEIVRDDVSEPFLTVIKLDLGRYVLGTECQYRPVDWRPAS